MKKQILAADYGASGGRVMLGEYDGSRIRTSQVHRFVNEPVWLGGTMFWDFLRLFHELKTGIKKAQAYGKADSIGVDTWGVDFGLIDKRGFLLENPVHYRDGRTAGMLEAAWKKVDRDRIYEITGNQFMEINTAFQLLSLAQNRPELLDRAEKLLLMPDLFNYGLCGTACSEYTMASTTQLLDAVAKDWSRELIRGLGLPEKIFLPVIQPGTVLGPLDGRICSELEVKPLDVVAVAGHDTQCALAAVPAREKDFIFVSCKRISFSSAAGPGLFLAPSWKALSSTPDPPGITSPTREPAAGKPLSSKISSDCGWCRRAGGSGCGKDGSIPSGSWMKWPLRKREEKASWIRMTRYSSLRGMCRGGSGPGAGSGDRRCRKRRDRLYAASTKALRSNTVLPWKRSGPAREKNTRPSIWWGAAVRAGCCASWWRTSAACPFTRGPWRPRYTATSDCS